ncbi:MAG: hypothetical protein QG623_698 [Patescibacteria group bacterium]|nr:hypothetical protein [Patescibacteria group bacterium]
MLSGINFVDMNVLANIYQLIATVYEDVGLPKGDISTFGENAKNLVFVIAGVITIYIILSAGFKYVTSGGNAEDTKKAGQTIVYGAVGLFIILMSYVIITWVFKVGGA